MGSDGTQRVIYGYHISLSDDHFGNLTRNTCSVLDQEGQSLHSLDCGSYDAMVNGVLGSVAPEYRDEFTSKFARQNQLAEYERGAHETYMEHRQLLDDGQYHWVSAHKIKVENPVNDDILTVSLIRCIDEQKDNEAEKIRFAYCFRCGRGCKQC